ncbi:MAG: tetratricopeptide repeat protein [Terriglobales bacterium]
MPKRFYLSSAAGATLPQDPRLPLNEAMPRPPCDAPNAGGRRLSAHRLASSALTFGWFLALALAIPRVAAAQALPPVARAQLRRAAAAVDAGHTAAAIPQLQRLVRQFPQSPAVAETLGLAWVGDGQPAAALPWLRRAAALAPDSASALANVGITELRLGHRRRGIAALRRAVALAPDNFDNVYDLGQALASVGAFPASARYLRQAHALQPARPDVAYNLAWVEHRAGQNARAEQALASVPQLRQTAAAQSLWGAISEARGQYEAAARHLQAAVRLAPTEINYLTLGAEFLRHLTWQAARVTLQQGLVRFPRSRKLRTALAVTAYGQLDFPAAIRALGPLTQAYPRDAFLAGLLGRACLSGGLARQAPCRSLIRLATTHPANSTAAAYAAVICLRTAGPGSAARALQLARGAIRRDPRLAQAHYAAGLALGQAGRWRASIPEFQTALRLDPGNVSIAYQLALAYSRTGQTALAQRAIRRRARLQADQQNALNRRLEQVRRFLVTVGPAPAASH